MTIRRYNAGDALPPLEKPSVTREQLREYAEASGDKNPIHLDETFAREAGFPTVIVHGMLSMAYLGDYAAGLFPRGEYRLRRFSSRFKKVIFPGDRLRCEGVIKSVAVDGAVTATLQVKNQKDEVATEGEVEFLPTP